MHFSCLNSVLLAILVFCLSKATATDKFSDANDFEGWNCGSITICGDLGQFCGGFNVKGTRSDLKKTYTNLPAGTYSVELDFIKIDSWFVCEMLSFIA